MTKTNWPKLKQFSDLTPKDFEEHQIWVSCHSVDYDEPWYDDTDEETYRPYKDSVQIDPSEEEYLVKADFKLNDGTVLNGFFTPQNAIDNEDAISYIQPHIFINGDSYRFWFGIAKPDEEYLSEFYDKLGKTPDEVFPLTYKSSSEVIKGGIKGRVNGFGYIE